MIEEDENDIVRFSSRHIKEFYVEENKKGIVETVYRRFKMPCQAAAEKFGLNNAKSFKTNRYLNNGDEVKIGNQILGVRHCPGHTPGHIIFFHEKAKLAVVGDVIFQGSIGRSDLPRGNHEELVNSIVRELWPLGDEMTFIPGHGPLSTFGQERLTNPYVSDFALGIEREISQKVKDQENNNH